jgi:tRNA U55 pseudouridine synthase TruB
LASAREALSCWETAQALGWVGTLDPEVTALFNRVIGTLVRLSQPRR